MVGASSGVEVGLESASASVDGLGSGSEDVLDLESEDLDLGLGAFSVGTRTPGSPGEGFAGAGSSVDEVF